MRGLISLWANGWDAIVFRKEWPCKSLLDQF
jgi:hypothetical protein